MKTTRLWSLAVMLVTLSCRSHGAGAETQDVLRLSVELADGSRILGVPAVRTLAIRTAYARMDIPLEQVSRMTVASDHENVVMALRKGDLLTGVLDLPAVSLTTVFGKVSIPIMQVMAVSVLSGGLSGGLVLHYTFDEDEAAGNVKDSSGRGNDGYTVGAVKYETGRKGKGARFTGPGSYILSEAKELNTDGWKEITVSLWCRFQQYTTYGSLIGRGEVTGTKVGGFGIQVGGAYGGKWNTGGRGVGSLELPTRTFQAGVNPYPAIGQWYHISMTYDGQVGRFYVNGAVDGEARCAQPGQPLVDSPATKLVIGTTSTKPCIDWSDMYFNGTVDDVMIFNRALSETEIQEIGREQLR